MVEVSFSIVEGMQWVLVTVKLKIYPIGGLHEEEHFIVPPHALLVFISL